ncbi:MAG: tRNA (guanosine(37)-N1)-methyltransferase TrmD [Endomicrobiales bacterium]
MRIDILTIFPGMFTGPLTESLLKKAREKGILRIQAHDIRSFTTDKHHSVDDRPFGGGPGMVMKVEPVYRALQSLGAAKKNRGKPPRAAQGRPLVVYLSPQGTPLTQDLARELSRSRHLVLLCGHYEGIDERLMHWVDREISIGDYVLTGGELPAMVLIDVMARLLPGVVKESGSVEQDSFYNGLLDYPHYTRPAEFKGREIPPVLLSGNHAAVEKWRRQQSLLRTRQKRPDLLKKTALSPEDRALLQEVLRTKTKKKQTKNSGKR